MVELRKRPAPVAAPPPAKKKAPTKAKATKKDDAPKATDPPASNPAEDPSGGIPEGAGGVSNTADIKTVEDANATAAEVEKAAVKGKKGAATAAKKTAAAPVKGDKIELDGFGGEVETNDGEKTSLTKLVATSKAGVVLFTYPKASTPGCTTQACLFRDSYEPLTSTGLSIYGLSSDSPKANTTFKTKQNLPYPLLCDPSQTLISAIGFKKSPSGTTRGVFVVSKSGEVLAVEAGGPAPTVEVVRKLVAGMGGDGKTEDEAKADVAGEVADTAAKMDTGV
nr:peroxiredoxin dot5 [Quercus suber]